MSKKVDIKDFYEIDKDLKDVENGVKIVNESNKEKLQKFNSVKEKLLEMNSVINENKPDLINSSNNIRDLLV